MLGLFIEQILGLIVLISGLRIFIAVYCLSWFPSFLVKGGYDPHSSRLIAGSLANCLDKRADLRLTLEPLIGQVDAKSGRRLRSFLDEFGASQDLSSAIEESQLLPLPQRQIIDVCDDNIRLVSRSLLRYAEYQENSMVQNTVLSNALSTISVLMAWIFLFLSFLMIMIVPKFEFILRELAVELPSSTELVITVSRAMGRYELLGIIGASLSVILVHFLPRAASWWWHSWQPGRMMVMRGFLLLDGLALGLSEMDLARVLNVSGGSQHSLPELVAECGFRAQSAEALASELHQRQTRRSRLEEYLGIFVAIGLWFFVALTVGFVVYALFAPIVYMMGGID